MAQYPKVLDDFLKDKFREYLKLLLVFKGKGYSWKKELQNKFSIADDIVNEGLKILEKEGFLISKDFWSLDLDLQEIIRRMDGAYFSHIKTFPKVYVLNNDERTSGWLEVNEDKIKLRIDGNNSILHTMNLVSESSKNVEKLQKKFQELENNDYKRVRYDPDSNVYYETLTRKESERTKRLAVELEEARLEFINKPKLTKTEKSELAILENKSTALSIITNPEKRKLKHSINGKEVDIETFRRKEKELELLQKKDNKIENTIDKEQEKLLEIDLKNDEYRIKGQLEKVKVNEYVEGYGKRIEELEQEASSIDSWEVFLGVSDKKVDESDIENELDKKIHELKYQLIDKGFLDAYVTRKQFDSDKDFIKFQESLKNLNVSFDGTDFIYDRNNN